MCVDDVGEPQASVPYLIFQIWHHADWTIKSARASQKEGHSVVNLLCRVRWVYDDGFFGLVICDDVGIVVPGALPFESCQQFFNLQLSSWVLIHMGIDRMCIARVVTGCLSSVYSWAGNELSQHLCNSFR